MDLSTTRLGARELRIEERDLGYHVLFDAKNARPDKSPPRPEGNSYLTW
jgi:hypothetical protein